MAVVTSLTRYSSVYPRVLRNKFLAPTQYDLHFLIVLASFLLSLWIALWRKRQDSKNGWKEWLNMEKNKKSYDLTKC